MKLPLVPALAALAAVALSATVLADRQAGTKPAIGLQLYSLRESFKTDVPGTLDKVKALAIQEVEIAGVQGQKPDAFKKMLEDRGLKALSGHWPFEQLDKNPQSVIDEAKTLGCRYIACAWVPHGSVFTEADAHKAAEVFNRVGELANKNGLKFAYHAHGYEFQPHGDGTLYDLMMKEMKPGVADFEMDVFWMVHPGQDPVKLLEKYGPRYKLMHLKDWKKGCRGNLSGHAPNEESVALGTGVVDWPAVIKAAEKAGVEHYFIEDEAPTVEAQLPVTIAYLKTVGF